VSDQRKTLEHALNETDVMMCPGLVLYDERGRALSVKLGGQLFLSSEDGDIQLKCACDGHDITDVVDPAGDVSLVLNLVGAGSVGNSPIVEGSFVLGLRWLRE
jgi:hypothetical protein